MFKTSGSHRACDEFVIVIPESGAEAAALVARRIHERVAGDHEEPPFSASVGTAVYPHDGQTMETLLGAADRSLYEMKRRGHGGQPLKSAHSRSSE
jgi:diguanylate cyclase (GGDEF)-like protein